MNFLKKIMVLCFSALAVAGYCSSDKYEVVVLGDLHYDAADLRVNVDKLLPHRKKEMERNLKAWQQDVPGVLKAAAAYSAKNSTLFTVQCGDITQGDEGKYEFACTSFERVIKLVNQDQQKPVYIVRGNHDVRGTGKTKASNKVLHGYMKKQDVVFPMPGKEQTSYKIVGEDLFIFFDSMKESLEALELAFKAKPDARHVFFFTHIPVMPCKFSPGSINWICGRYSKNGDKIRALLAKHNTIVFAAHIHATTYFEWKLPEGSIKQFTSYSIPRDPSAEVKKINLSGEKYFKDFEVHHYPVLKEKDRNALHNFLKGFMGKLDHVVSYKNISGFNVLRIEGKHVFVDMYSGKLDKVLFTQQIK